MNSRPAPLAALEQACARTGLDTAGAEVIYQRANVVYKLARQPVVARLRYAPDPAKVAPRLATSLEVTAWLGRQGFPAVQPLAVAQPVPAQGYLVTFWHYIPATGKEWRDIDSVGRLLRELHDLPAPPVRLHATNPLGSVREDAARCDWLGDEHRSWLLRRCDELQQQYAGATSALGCGLLHGDAHAGNLIHARDRTVLCDWDAASYGPREQDLAPICVGYRYGRPDAEWRRLCEVYQVDPAQLPGLPLLERMRELRALTPYLRATAGKASAEVARRIDDMISGRQQRPWQPLDMSKPAT